MTKFINLKIPIVYDRFIENIFPKLIDLVDLIGEETLNYKWVIGDIEIPGESALKKKIEEAESDQITLSGTDFLKIIKDIDQIIWGVFLALPKDAEPPKTLSAEKAFSESPQNSKAIFEFRAIDGEYYECFFKDEKWKRAFEEEFLKKAR